MTTRPVPRVRPLQPGWGRGEGAPSSALPEDMIEAYAAHTATDAAGTIA